MECAAEMRSKPFRFWGYSFSSGTMLNYIAFWTPYRDERIDRCNYVGGFQFCFCSNRPAMNRLPLHDDYRYLLHFTRRGCWTSPDRPTSCGDQQSVCAFFRNGVFTRYSCEWNIAHIELCFFFFSVCSRRFYIFNDTSISVNVLDRLFFILCKPKSNETDWWS